MPNTSGIFASNSTLLSYKAAWAPRPSASNPYHQSWELYHSHRSFTPYTSQGPKGFPQSLDLYDSSDSSDNHSNFEITYRNHDRRPSTMLSIETVPIALPAHTARFLDPHAILILPSSLTNITAHIISRHKTRDTVILAVAGDLRLHEIVKQLLGPRITAKHHIRIDVRRKGEWRQPGLETKVNDLKGAGLEFGRDGQVEIRIDFGGGDDVRGGWEAKVLEPPRRRGSKDHYAHAVPHGFARPASEREYVDACTARGHGRRSVHEHRRDSWLGGYSSEDDSMWY